MTAYYTIMVVMIVCTMLVMVTGIHTSRVLSRKKKNYFRLLFGCIAVAALCEWIGICLQGTGNGTRMLHIAVKIIELSLAPCIAVLISTAIEARLQKVILVFLLAHVFLEALSARFSFIYRVDVDSNYMHGQFYWIYIAVYMISICYGGYIIVRNMKKYQYNGLLFFGLIFLFMILGIVVQLFNSDLKVGYVFVGITALMLYIFNLDMIHQTDELTGLINRRGYENCIEHLDKKSYILMFDIDEFKAVNDRYGHQTGDLCLKEIGRMMKSTYAEYGKCFRIGGDEFCVIISRELYHLGKMNHRFFAQIEEARKNCEWMPWISLGYGLADPQANNVQEIISRADEQMYQIKKTHKRHAKANPESLTICRPGEEQPCIDNT